MSNMKFADSCFALGGLGIKHKIPELRDISLSLLNIIPTGKLVFFRLNSDTSPNDIAVFSITSICCHARKYLNH